MHSFTRPAPGRRARARRRGQRGAALVEAAFMLPMFVILWYGGLYMHNLGKAHIDTNSKAREQAWSTAMANCGTSHDSTSERLPPVMGGSSQLPSSGGTDGGSMASTAFGQGNIGGALGGIISGVTSAISSIFPNPSGGIGQQTISVSYRVPDLYDRTANAGNTTVTGTLTIVCNEAPQDGTLWNVISAIVSGIKSLF